VTGENGVGREVYVRVSILLRPQITFRQRLFDAEGTQRFTFTV
jgi:hypothetical protein